MTEADVDKLVQRTVDVRSCPPGALENYRGMMLGDVVERPAWQNRARMGRAPTYIALGNLMTSAALLGVDAWRMEGLVPAEYDGAC